MILMLLPTVICCCCWAITICLVLIRRLRQTQLIGVSNGLVSLVQLINLGYCLPALVDSLQRPLPKLIMLVTRLACLTDTVSTLGLLIFFGISFAQHWRPFPRSVDYLVTLGAATNHGKPSLILQARLRKTIQLWLANPSAQIVVTGTRLQREALTEAQVMKKFLVDHGIPARQIIEEPLATNTWQNLTYTRRLVQLGSHVVVVTSDFHVLRTKSYLERQGLQWLIQSATTPLVHFPLAVTRDYLGIIRDHYRWALGLIAVLFLLIELI